MQVWENRTSNTINLAMKKILLQKEAVGLALTRHEFVSVSLPYTFQTTVLTKHYDPCLTSD